MSETLVTSEVTSSFSKKLGFVYSFTVDCIGRSGGLAVLWKQSVSCVIKDSSTNHINVSILDHDVLSWQLTCFYGFPERTRRRES